MEMVAGPGTPQPPPPEGSLPPPLPVTPAYHQALCSHFRATEPELWSWFSEAGATATGDQSNDDDAEVELLKSTYRLDGGVHDVLTGHAALLAGRLGLVRPVELYQELGGGERNARVFDLNQRTRVVFGGDLLDLLNPTEQQAVLAHELAHVALWERHDGEFLVLDHLVHRMVEESGESDALNETARRLRLHTEVWADTVAAAVVDDDGAMVSTVVKLNTGLRNVDPEAYLSQARQIIESDPGSSRSLSHPEMHIRVSCIAARTRPGRDKLIETLIGGPDDLDRLDVLGQLRMHDMVAAVMAGGIRSSPSLGLSAGAAGYVKSYPMSTATPAKPPGDRQLSASQPSVRYLGAAVLVDLALVDDELDGLDELRALSREAERVGVGEEFDRILSRATERTPAETRRLRQDAS